MIVFHGSKKIIKHPEFGYGNVRNDYGLGFYCTENIELAKEWACSGKDDGWANQYQLNTANLNILYLNRKPYHILNWLAILLKNRTFVLSSNLSIEAKTYIINNFLPEYEHYDVIVGYRADDSYFSFSQSFLNNTISLEQLNKAMHLGKLGEQIVIRSPKAFSELIFLDAIVANGERYYAQRQQRDLQARLEFQKEKTSTSSAESIYMIDILRQKWTNEDPRLS